MARDRNTDEVGEKPTRRGSRIWAALPRRPRFQRPALRATDQWHGLREDMARTRHTCPQDGASMGLTDVFAQDANGDVPQGAEPYRALVCPECSFTVPVAVIIERAKRQAEPLKKTERALVLFGFTILVLFSVIALLNSNFLTLIGATIMALMVFIKALFVRYQHWQAVNGRMFEDESPFREFLSQELKQ